MRFQEEEGTGEGSAGPKAIRTIQLRGMEGQQEVIAEGRRRVQVRDESGGRVGGGGYAINP